MGEYYSDIYGWNRGDWVDNALIRYFNDKFDSSLFNAAHERKNTDTMSAREESAYIRARLEAGYICGLTGGGSLSAASHACTLYGAEFDEDTGLMTKAWIADPGPGAEDNALEVFSVSNSQGELLFKKTYKDDQETWVEQFSTICIDVLMHDTDFDHFFPQIPEPSMFGLLAGTGVLAFAALRRRRGKV